MKKRFWILLLILVLLPGSSLFAGCGAQNGYNLSNLNKDFYSIADENTFIVKVGKELHIDYAQKQDEKEKDYLNTLMNNDAYPYKYLKEFDKLLKNILDFTYQYIEVCSTYEINVDKDLRNKTQEDLNILKKEFADFDYTLDSFTDIVFSNIDDKDQLNTSNLSGYKRVLNKYEDLLEKSINFSEDISIIYYSALNDANPNFLEFKDNFDASMVVSRIENRAKYQTNNLTRIFVEKYIAGANLATKISNNQAAHIFESTEYENYKSAVATLSSKIETEKAIEKANANADFFELSVQMYNAQEMLNNDYDKFMSACNEIDYQDVLLKQDKEETENLCIKIINDFDSLVNEYNTVLVKLINIMLGV